MDDPWLSADRIRNNDFTYAADPRGGHVPLGSHMRRMNPRDTKMAPLTDVNVPQDPIRRGIHDIRTFNVLRGGEYLFMPSLSTLRWLGEEC